ncbi:MAG: 2-(1,2-epoxy-1,2-dihydrophenyl)acetyl-CoA isomerase PaaG [Pseudomonas sp.]|uniref:2-(1,2-epoxy-1,2-dihydrophenyl)acetyl-CoA isomerase PaaG n=1 Tax=Pseudomonas sp. TaxID=306 RepID=UPI003981C0F7
MELQAIRFEVENGIARLTLARPEQLNAFTVQMHTEVAYALDRVENERGIRVLLITGAGRAFCAGQDLGERNVDAGPLDLGSNIEKYYNPLVRRLVALPVPVVCAVNGVAAGAGVNLALACDITIARKSAKFVQAFSAIGLVPDAGGTWTLPRAIGQTRALAFVLSGEPLSAERAEEWGMIWKAVDDESFDAQVDALVQRLGAGPTRGLVNAKRAIRAASTATLEEQLDLERDLQRESGLTDDYREGVTAFKQKRAPRFTGI